MSDAYAFWRAALKGDISKMTDAIQAGIWKVAERKGGPLVPVRIWPLDDSGELLTGTIAGFSVENDYLSSVWLFCKPASKADFAHYTEHGVWPGEVGHNSGGNSPIEELDDLISSASDWIKKTPIKDQITADMASNFRAKLLALTKTVDAMREAEKAPHLAAGKAVDTKYKPKIGGAEMVAEQLRSALTAWMRADEAAKQAAADKKHKEAVAAAAAERARIEAERAAKMASDPIAVLTDPEPELPMAPPPPEPVKVQAGGQSGRKTGFRSVTRYVVNDYAAALEFVKDHAKVKAAVQEVAAAMAKAGAVVPGVETIIEKVAA